MENQLCDILKNINASANFGRRVGVSFPIFDGGENEDVFEFLDKFKRAATLNGWNDDDLPIGLPLYLKGHASAWFKCLQGANEITFDELSAVCSMFKSQFSICFILCQCCVTQPSSLNQQINCAFIGHNKLDFSFVTFINWSDNEFSKLN